MHYIFLRKKDVGSFHLNQAQLPQNHNPRIMTATNMMSKYSMHLFRKLSQALTVNSHNCTHQIRIPKKFLQYKELTYPNIMKS